MPLRIKTLLIRVFVVLAITETVYLSLVNLALNLPITQSLINQHRPDKYAIYWEMAWSWYPLEVHATGISVNGQTSSQQWQADVPSVSASVALLPLLQRTVKVYGVDAQDVSFRLRPRPKPERDYGAILAFFPPIRDRDPDSPAVVRKSGKKGDGWKIVVDELHARGSHEFWVRQVRGTLDGVLRANATYETRGGPFALNGEMADVELRSLTVNKDWEVSSGGSVKGRFEFAPFVPSENPGLSALAFVSVDADIDAPVDSLGFLDFYLRERNGMEIDGKGRLRGRLKYEKGNLMSGTDIAVSAKTLALNAVPFEVLGAGEIGVAVEPEDPETLSIEIRFGTLQTSHRNDPLPLFTGKGLEVVARGTTRVLPDEARQKGSGRLSVTIPSVQIPDLRVYQRYLPAKWGVELKDGHGSLQGRMEYSTSGLAAELDLVSDDADLRVKDYRFRTRLDLGLKVSGRASDMASIDLSGTHLRLDDARLANEGKGASEPWNASLSIAQGTLGIPIPERETENQGFRKLAAALRAQGFKGLLASADAQLDADLSVSDLAWVKLFFRNPFNLSISGSGEIAADLRLESGWLAQGTKLQARPKGLTVQVLDYVVQGNGGVVMEVVKGGELPDLRLDARLSDGKLRRRGEQDAVVEQVALEVSAVATDVALGGGGRVAAMDLRIPSASVTDMRVYNQYLPDGSPLELLSGQAELTADIHLEPKSAGGFVDLKTKGLRSRLDDQELSGELTLNIKLQDGVPSDMDFDISGSSLLLDGFKVAGEQQSVDDSHWSARFDLPKARTVWKKPVLLDMEAEIEMKDSRPIVALLANQRGKHGWLEKILTVEDVSGSARMNIEADRAVVPYALVGSDKIDVGVKGLVDSRNREGMFYARFRKLHGILKMKDGERNFDIAGARKKFEDYIPGETPLGLTAAGRPESTDAAPGSEQETSENFIAE